MKKSELKEMIKAAFLAEKEEGEVVDPYMAEGESVEEDLDEMLARLSEEEVVAEFRADSDYFAKQLEDLEADYKAGKIGPIQYQEEKEILNRYLQETISEEEVEEVVAEAEEDLEADLEADIDTPEGDEEVDVDVDVDAEETPAKNDSIVIDKKIVSLSSLPGETRKILDTLETLRAQAEEFGDQKFMTQVGNTITFFTRDFVVAGDAPNPAGIEESLVTEDLVDVLITGLDPDALGALKNIAMKLQTSPKALINGLGMVTGGVGGAVAGIKALTSDKVENFVNTIFGKKKEDAEAMEEGDESANTKMEAELELEENTFPMWNKLNK